MRREDFLAQSEDLMARAQAAIDNDDLDAAEALQQELETLRNKYERGETMRANLEALNGAARTPEAANVLRGGQRVELTDETAEPESVYESPAYKNALMQFVVNRVPIPEKFRNTDAGTVSSEVAAVIPQTTVQKIVDRIAAKSPLLEKITRTAYKGGVVIPVADAKPTAYWVTEGAASGDGVDTQEVTLGTSITFGYYKLRCTVRISLETAVMSYPVFEAHLATSVGDAMAAKLEQSVVAGTGSGQPKGILAETVATGQNVNITEGSSFTWATLAESDGLIPTGYDDGTEWFMTRKTFYGQIVSLKDSTGQPIARVDAGLDGKPAARILGRPVNFVEHGLANYAASVSADTVVAFLFRPADYMLNTNYDLKMKKYTDDRTDDECMKAVMLVDGKVIDKNSLVTVTIKNG